MRAEPFRQPESFRYEEADGIATITFDRADRLNALTFQVYAELRDVIADLEHRRHVRAVIVTGTGRGFCSGGDVEDIIGPLLAYDTEQLLAFTRMTGALIANIRRLSRPVVAALNGIAAGAGAVIALAADFRIGTDRSPLAFLFTKVGLAGADMGAAWLLPRVVGLARATEILFLGDKITPEEALRLGLLNRLVPGDRLMDEARALARRLADGPTFAIGVTKTLLNEEWAMSLEQGIEAEAQAQALCMRTPNFNEAYAAFVEKRSPRFV
jgi:enoyl-CoA hydratase/carnithine racemase